jgi:hypothetical protein
MNRKKINRTDPIPPQVVGGDAQAITTSRPTIPRVYIVAQQDQPKKLT